MQQAPRALGLLLLLLLLCPQGGNTSPEPKKPLIYGASSLTLSLVNEPLPRRTPHRRAPSPLRAIVLWTGRWENPTGGCQLEGARSRSSSQWRASYGRALIFGGYAGPSSGLSSWGGMMIGDLFFICPSVSGALLGVVDEPPSECPETVRIQRMEAHFRAF